MIRFMEEPNNPAAVSRMVIHPEGQWVRYEDVIKLERQLKHFLDQEKAKEYIRSIP